MSRQKIASKAVWLFNRLTCMSFAEVLYRFRQAFVTQALRLGILNSGGAPAVRTGRDGASVLPKHPHIEALAYVVEADAILSGRVILFSARAFDVGVMPLWNRDPLTGVTGPARFSPSIAITNRDLVGDIKHVWELNRHLHLVRLAQAYVLNGDQRYLDGIAKQLTTWLDQCPPNVGPNWTSSLELGIRLINWSLIWQMVGGWDSELFKGANGAAFRTRWLSSVFAHCQFIRRHFSRHSSANNHLIGELAGLYVASRIWPYWTPLEEWGVQAKMELEREAVLQHFDDGVNREQAFAYQVFTAEFLVMAGLYGQRSNDPFSSDFWSSLGKSFNFLRAITDFGGHVPMVGDADDGIVIRLEPGEATGRAAMLLALGDAIFDEDSTGQRTDTARWLLGDISRLRPKQVNQVGTTWQFPEGGYYIFGSDFGLPTEVKGMVDCGPLGYLGIAAHGHSDALAITLSIGGEECLIDPGTFSYWNELKWRDYFRGTSAHNTVAIDDKDQSISGGRFMWTRKASARIDQAPLSPNVFDFVGSHDGYMRLADPVRHSRAINYDAASLCLAVCDDVHGAVVHKVDQFWHFAPTLTVSIAGNTAIVTGKGFTLHAEFSGNGLELALFEGSENPPLGWISCAYESKEPTRTLRVRAETKGVSISARFRIEFFQ